MKRLPLLLALCAALAACTSYSYLKVTRMTPAQLKQASDAEICNAYSHTRAEPRTRQAPIREEMLARGLLTDEEWPLVEQRQLRPGMSKLALIACWGYPKRATRALHAGGDTLVAHEQYIYEGSAGWSTLSVYLEDGVIAGWREWSEVEPREIDQYLPGVRSRPGGIVREPAPGYEPTTAEPLK
ncbi:MAG: hypothetical protein FJY75_13230 [Candidatus Eisenbacteria bacterium]|uniref:Uncharacterized protein n=1 Tax=Eiseniibacteriota bacterium TaxID=2212470 RepID=A0A937XBK9_UNCEI|nr:hypothetical protein [Candidatus Eisenbacteria bacterium]